MDLPQPIGLTASQRRAARKVLPFVLALALLTLGSQVAVWNAPVSAYAVVVRLTSTGKAVMRKSSDDARVATQVRSAINSYAVGVIRPVCSHELNDSLAGAYTFVFTFWSAGTLIETVTGYTDDCGAANIRCPLYASIWTQDLPESLYTTGPLPAP